MGAVPMATPDPCLACGSTRVRLRWRQQRHHPDYFSCRDCGLVFAFPQREVDYEHAPSDLPTDDEYQTRLRSFAIRYQRIKRYLPTGEPHVLDVGCNNGVFLSYAKEQGCKVLGIEPSLDYARYARERFGLDVIRGAFESHPFEQRFGLITLFNVLEHTKDPRDVLAKAYGLLQENGLLMLELPYVFTLQGLASFRRWHHFEETHNWFFGKSNITRLLEHLGYEVLLTSFVPKVVPLTRMFDCLLSRTVYMHVKRSTYLGLRQSRFYRFMNGIEVRVNILDYLLVVARRPQAEPLPDPSRPKADAPGRKR